MTDAAQPLAAPRAVRRIQRSRGFVPIDFQELWAYKELLYFLIWRDVKARYKQTYLGPFWAIFRPVVSTVLFTLFGRIAHINSGSAVPYPLFVYGGMLAWTYFASALSGVSSSILNSGSLLSKVYFPRLYAPFAAVVAPLVDLALTLLVLCGLFVYYRWMPSPYVPLLFAFIFLAMLAGLGPGLWLAGIMVRYRDVGFALPFFIQLGVYVTPIIYPVSFVPREYRWLIDLNPLTAVVEGARWSIFGTGAPSAFALAAGTTTILFLFVTGLYWFRRTERTIADMM